MAKSKWTPVGERKKNGKKVGTVIRHSETGEERTLMTQHGKCQKYAYELEKGVMFTNTGEVKKDKKGNPKKLTRGQRTYRRAYINALGESAAIYNSKKGGNK